MYLPVVGSEIFDGVFSFDLVQIRLGRYCQIPPILKIISKVSALHCHIDHVTTTMELTFEMLYI